MCAARRRLGSGIAGKAFAYKRKINGENASHHAQESLSCLISACRPRNSKNCAAARVAVELRKVAYHVHERAAQ